MNSYPLSLINKVNFLDNYTAGNKNTVGKNNTDSSVKLYNYDREKRQIKGSEEQGTAAEG